MDAKIVIFTLLEINFYNKINMDYAYISIFIASITELISKKINIDDNFLHAVYIFQQASGRAIFRAIWTSSRAKFL